MTAETASLDTYNNGGILSMVTTPRLHETAQSLGVTGIRFDDEAVHLVAEAMEIIPKGEPLPPLMFLARRAGKVALGDPDIHWAYGIAQEHSFYPAANIGSNQGFSCHDVMAYARGNGVLKMHELNIILDDDTATHIEEVARALSVGGRSISTDQAGGMLADDSRANLIKRLARIDHSMPSPIIIERQPV